MVAEVSLPGGAGVMRGGPQGWVLGGHWPSRAPLALLSALEAFGVQGDLTAAWYVYSDVLATGFIKSSDKEGRFICQALLNTWA